MSDRKIYWRCFHCGDAFTKAQERWAREHFGDDLADKPVCLMRLPGESALLTVLRKTERELRRYRAEDTDLIRAIYAMRADHAQALRREEERGYEKGLADGRALGPEPTSPPPAIEAGEVEHFATANEQKSCSRDDDFGNCPFKRTGLLNACHGPGGCLAPSTDGGVQSTQGLSSLPSTNTPASRDPSPPPAEKEEG